MKLNGLRIALGGFVGGTKEFGCYIRKKWHSFCNKIQISSFYCNNLQCKLSRIRVNIVAINLNIGVNKLIRVQTHNNLSFYD